MLRLPGRLRPALCASSLGGLGQFALQLRVNADPENLAALLLQLRDLLARRPVDGRVVVRLARLHQAVPAPLVRRPAPGGGTDSGGGRRQDQERLAPRAPTLPADHKACIAQLREAPSGGEVVPAETGVREVPEADRPVDREVVQRLPLALLERHPALVRVPFAIPAGPRPA